MKQKTDKAEKALSPWREKIYEIIFEADTPAGKSFDITLLILIIISILAVMLESVEGIQEQYGVFLNVLEWILTVLFTLEYILRMICVRKPWKYAISFYGIIDLLSVLPTYIAYFFIGSQTKYLIVIRALRLMRVFRIFKLAHFLIEGRVLLHAIRMSMAKITVFLVFVLLLVIVLGSLMYLIEVHADSGFDSIPRSIYWAIVTLTTVGYGDIAPATPLGQFFAAFIMILGYAVLAVPTGIVTMELTANRNKSITTQTCPSCTREGHDADAIYCKYCSEPLS